MTEVEMQVGAAFERLAAPLVEQVAELNARLAALDPVDGPRVSALEGVAAGCAKGATATPARYVAPDYPDPAKPFDVNLDENGDWDIYLPDGCVMVGPNAAVYDGERDGDDVAPLTPHATVYGHVYRGGSDSENGSGGSGSENDSGGGGWKYSIDGNETKDDAKYNFPIVGFDGEYNELTVQFVSGVVCFSDGEGGLPGVFEPVYDDDGKTVTGFKNCYYQVGGFTHDLGDQDLDPNSTGFVVLAVGVSGSATSASPSAYISVYSSLSLLNLAQRDLSTVKVPLYKVEDSKIEVDMRRTPMTGVFEFFPSSPSGES